MPVLWIITIGLFAMYSLRILSFLAGWYRSLRSGKRNSTGPGKPETRAPEISLVIPVRNEEANLGLLLEDLEGQDYPAQKIEIIVVDDHSEDHTAALVREHKTRLANLRLIRLDSPDSGKKAALEKGIRASAHSLILNTDGDCRVGPGWIAGMVKGFANPAIRLVAGAVLYEPDRGPFPSLQSLEHFSLTAVTAGSAGLGDPLLCSAANLAYYRKDYLEFIRQEGKVTESGDDVFLMFWIKKQFPNPFRFAVSRETLVRTSPAVTPGDFFMQRLRWASKSRHYRDRSTILTALLVFGMNACLTILLLGGIAGSLAGWEGQGDWILAAAVLLGGKSVVDFLLLHPVLKHYGKTGLLRYFLPLEIIYFMYVSLTGLCVPFFSYRWKGRKETARR